MENAELVMGKFILGRYSKVGDELKGRRDLEDRCDCRPVATDGGLKLIVAVVADGVGGNHKGELAAQTALDSVYAGIEKSQETNISILLEQIVQKANQDVYAYTQGDLHISSTLVVGVVCEDRLYVANVGDSRAHLIRKGKITQLTRDHNFAIINKVSAQHKNAATLVRAMGLKPTVEVDQGFYVGTDDETVAFERGAQGLPLKPGDTVMLCSDGLIKSSRQGERYAKDEEIIEATQREFAPHMAAKAMVSIATGRAADDNVSAVTIQFLDPEMLAEARRQTQAYKRRQALIRYGLVAGGAALLLLVVFLGIRLSSAQGEMDTIAKRPTATPVVQTIMMTQVERVITNTPAPTLAPTKAVKAGDIVMQDFKGSATALISGVESPLVKEMPLQNETRITTGADSGAKIVVGDQNGPGILYLYADTVITLKIDKNLHIELLSGAVYIQPPPGKKGEVSLPNHSKATAYVSGSRMVVDVRPLVKGVKVWCFEGDCQIDNTSLEGFKVPEMQDRLFDPTTGKASEPKPMTYEEQWLWSRTCNLCLGSLVPTATPIIVMPTKPKASDTIVPPSENGNGSTNKPTQAPPPVATTQAPPPVATTQAPPPVATTQAPPPVATTQAPPPVATTKAPPPVATTEVPPPPKPTKQP